MQKLTNWKARRAGGRITINGVDDSGRDVKVTGIESIEAGSPHPVARVHGGPSFQLA